LCCKCRASQICNKALGLVKESGNDAAVVVELLRHMLDSKSALHLCGNHSPGLLPECEQTEVFRLVRRVLRLLLLFFFLLFCNVPMPR
jgi:hypothetical protein